MDILITTVGVVLFMVGLVRLIIGFFRKKGLKRPAWFLAIGFVLMLIGSSLADPVEEVPTIASDESAEQEQEETEPEPAPEPEPEPEQSEQPEESAEEEEQAEPKTLGYNPDEFIERFNSFADEFGTGLKIGSVTLEEGPVNDTFQYMLTDNIAIIGTVAKNGEMNGAMAIMQGDGTFESGANVLFTIGQIIAATNPKLTADERSEIFDELGLSDFEDINELDGTAVRNGVKYTLMGSDQVGIMFGADVAE